jgi:sporulation protein YlmC with PRC-barrel domain
VIERSTSISKPENRAVNFKNGNLRRIIINFKTEKISQSILKPENHAESAENNMKIEIGLNFKSRI